jgi:cytochrome c-type biogenesis protein CcmH
MEANIASQPQGRIYWAMVFLLLSAILTAIAVLAIAAPLFRRSRPVDSLSYDRDFYKARLAEIDNDVAMGRLGEEEARISRAEEGRKLIAASRQHEEISIPGGNSGRNAIVIAALAAPVLAILFYLAEGQPQMPDMALATRADRDLSQQSLEQLLERAEARLASEPGDLRGWTVVAPVYLRLGRTTEAVNAYRNAVRLSPQDSELMASLGEAIVAGEGGIVTAEAQTWFEQALAASPGAAKPRFYLAVAMGQQGEWQNAAQAWRTLIAEAPEDAPWHAAASAQLAEVERQLDGASDQSQNPQEAQGGPTPEEIEAASQMTSDDRQTMIEGMVESLAERLAEDPADKGGWRRLVRSYVVLGRDDDAVAAVADARRHFASDTQFMDELESMTNISSGGQAGE